MTRVGGILRPAAFAIRGLRGAPAPSQNQGGLPALLTLHGFCDYAQNDGAGGFCAALLHSCHSARCASTVAESKTCHACPVLTPFCVTATARRSDEVRLARRMTPCLGWILRTTNMRTFRLCHSASAPHCACDCAQRLQRCASTVAESTMPSTLCNPLRILRLSLFRMTRWVDSRQRCVAESLCRIWTCYSVTFCDYAQNKLHPGGFCAALPSTPSFCMRCASICRRIHNHACPVWILRLRAE